MNTKDLIQWQQSVAAKVIKPLHCMIDHTAILAGGAPRDWYHGRPARDLDFYISKDAFRLGYKNEGDNIQRLLCKVYNTKKITKLFNFGGYAPEGVDELDKVNGVLAIYESVYQGLIVQFIVCENTFTQLDRFSMSLSKFWWHPEKPIVIPSNRSLSGEHEISCIHNELNCKELESYDNEVILVYDSGWAGERYLKKIQAKYPDFEYILQDRRVCRSFDEIVDSEDDGW